MKRTIYFNVKRALSFVSKEIEDREFKIILIKFNHFNQGVSNQIQQQLQQLYVTDEDNS